MATVESVPTVRVDSRLAKRYRRYRTDTLDHTTRDESTSRSRSRGSTTSSSVLAISISIPVTAVAASHESLAVDEPWTGRTGAKMAHPKARSRRESLQAWRRWWRNDIRSHFVHILVFDQGRTHQLAP